MYRQVITGYNIVKVFVKISVLHYQKNLAYSSIILEYVDKNAYTSLFSERIANARFTFLTNAGSKSEISRNPDSGQTDFALGSIIISSSPLLFIYGVSGNILQASGL